MTGLGTPQAEPKFQDMGNEGKGTGKRWEFNVFLQDTEEK